jgi:hypothetical protein
MRLPAHVALLALGATALLLACSSGSGSTSLDGGSSGSSGTSGTAGTSGTSGTSGTAGTSGTSGGTATSQAIVRAKLVKGASGTCSAAGQSIAIGTFSPIGPVKNGDAYPGAGKVELSCSVVPAASGGFSVNVSFDVTNAGDAGGVAQGFAMQGARTATGTADGDALVAIAGPGLDWGSTTCTFDPTTVTVGAGAGGIAAGRYWTTFHCTEARTNGSSQLCDIDGEIRIENCLQQ